MDGDTKEPGRELRTAAVLFVENTKDGLLAKGLREIMERIKYIMGYNVKIVERGGTPLKLMFPLSKIGEGNPCSRMDCITCTQESGEGNIPPCTRRNILYENICRICNPGVGKGEDEKLSPFHICGGECT